jgi:hypothetical protein
MFITVVSLNKIHVTMIRMKRHVALLLHIATYTYDTKPILEKPMRDPPFVPDFRHKNPQKCGWKRPPAKNWVLNYTLSLTYYVLGMALPRLEIGMKGEEAMFISRGQNRYGSAKSGTTRTSALSGPPWLCHGAQIVAAL